MRRVEAIALEVAVTAGIGLVAYYSSGRNLGTTFWFLLGGAVLVLLVSYGVSSEKNRRSWAPAAQDPADDWFSTIWWPRGQEPEFWIGCLQAKRRFAVIRCHAHHPDGVAAFAEARDVVFPSPAATKPSAYQDMKFLWPSSFRGDNLPAAVSGRYTVTWLAKPRATSPAILLRQDVFNKQPNP